MFSDNLKSIRKSKGYSQEEVAVRLNVVRQTVSKWEKGLSVPDAEMLVEISEMFEVSVSQLLGAKIQGEPDTNEVAQQLSRINEQLAIKNRRSRRIWKTVLWVFAAFVLFNILLVVMSLVSYDSIEHSSEGTIITETEVTVP